MYIYIFVATPKYCCVLIMHYAISIISMRQRGSSMERTNPAGNDRPTALPAALPLEKNQKEKEDEYIEVFKYFENANIRNRDAFCELLDYTMENRRNTGK